MSDIELRDWFAGQALIGLLQRVSVEYPGDGETTRIHDYLHDTPSLAPHAYMIAEAMMHRRGLSLSRDAPQRHRSRRS